MLIQKKPVILFSAYQNDLSESTNIINHGKVLDDLDFLKIQPKVLIGCYKGNKELQILVTAKHEGNVLIFCDKYNQECYLKLDEDRNAELIFMNDEESQQLGKLVNVGATKPSSDYTYDKESNSYFTVRPSGC